MKREAKGRRADCSMWWGWASPHVSLFTPHIQHFLRVVTQPRPTASLSSSSTQVSAPFLPRIISKPFYTESKKAKEGGCDQIHKALQIQRGKQDQGFVKLRKEFPLGGTPAQLTPFMFAYPGCPPPGQQ